MRSRLKRVLNLPASAWLYLATASIELLLARIRFLTKSAKTIVDDLRRSQPGSIESAASNAVDPELLSWAIGVAARYVPWRSDCLIQAMAADRWLRRHNIEPDFFLGVTTDDESRIYAHAWLRYGEITITGPGHEGYVPLIKPGQRARV